MILIKYASLLAAALLGAVIVLQLILAAGAPLGHLAWGGRDRILPAGRRGASVLAAAILVMAGWTILARAALVSPGPDAPGLRLATWVFCGLFSLNTLGNLASRSRSERLLMTPVTAVLAACFAVVAVADG